MKIKKYTAEELSYVIFAYQNGTPVKEIAKRCGRNKQSIYYIAYKRSIPRGFGKSNKIFNTYDIKGITQMYMRGVSVSKIAKEYGRSVGSIYALMHRSGVRRYT